mmetsp:Transcript_121578/g.210373  ORF Transcript_121578/g.210373 Transcript_121578/m.210373 type:complete len:127 (+) Transcript_121578:67-447(+)
MSSFWKKLLPSDLGGEGSIDVGPSWMQGSSNTKGKSIQPEPSAQSNAQPAQTLLPQAETPLIPGKLLHDESSGARGVQTPLDQALHGSGRMQNVNRMVNDADTAFDEGLDAIDEQIRKAMRNCSVQ